MSDEEKKAIERLKDLISKSKVIGDIEINKQVVFKDIETILKLIEKQSKEIEELKQNIHLKEVYVLKTNDYIKGTNIEDELCNKKWEDKIKVKIEELQEDIKYSANPLSIDNSKFGIKVLQSLLEKE